MSVSGIVLTLGEGVDLDEARTALAGFPQVELGELNGRRLAAVTETGGRREDRDLYERLLDVPQVDNVEVAFVWFDDDSVGHPGATGPRRPQPHGARAPRTRT